MSIARLLALPLALALLASAPVSATTVGFADLATLSSAAPVVIRATIFKAERLKPRDAPDVAPGSARMLVSAATTSAIVAPGEVPPRITYLVDVPLDARGKPPQLLRSDVLLFLRGNPATPGEYTLVSAHGQLDWSADADAAVRAILTGARNGTVPVVTGVTSAFRVPGAVPGEAESQFFLSTRDGKPVSLVVLTRPGEARKLTIALGDVIDDAAAGVKPGTLLWYRLACFLPQALPAKLDAGADVADDYRFVLTSLGPCGRTF
ncbi:hypothetical protein KZX46_16285 [Polymorphobacter sp. PAMC 29334]|uniref:hypothetical protein n=1 Tax=Polymorphobacter sp. PAMC 29334 TaxID=2862331 RepID=UPI001C77D8AD|nr:hypothetical protein [Polymorphobacter sp. PAMC 29334]QYE34326.1 hypothetical protein KZX46_16285 [Polymorphobacter sp. PAMC 29334]